MGHVPGKRRRRWFLYVVLVLVFVFLGAFWECMLVFACECMLVFAFCSKLESPDPHSLCKVLLGLKGNQKENHHLWGTPKYRHVHICWNSP